MRAGGTVLGLLADPLCVPILRAHDERPLRLPDLAERMPRVAAGGLRGRVENLRRLGALRRQVRFGMPYTVENELTELGRDLAEVAAVLKAWLAEAPHGPIALGSESAKRAIKALVSGWDSTILDVLAARPFSLTELDGVIADISYPSLARRLSAMRAAHQLEAQAERGGSKPYVLTDWTRQAVGPLVTAGRCECRHLGEIGDAVTRIDVEAALLLALPLASLAEQQSGPCLLAVDTGVNQTAKTSQPLAGIEVEVEDCQVVSCVSRVAPASRTWALGTVEAWMDAIVDGRPERLRTGGERPELALSLVERLHAALAAS